MAHDPISSLNHTEHKPVNRERAALATVISRWYRLTVLLATIIFVVCGAISLHVFNQAGSWQSAYDISKEGWHKANIDCENDSSSTYCGFIKSLYADMQEARNQVEVYSKQGWLYLYAAAGLPVLFFVAYGAGVWVWTRRIPLPRWTRK